MHSGSWSLVFLLVFWKKAEEVLAAIGKSSFVAKHMQQLVAASKRVSLAAILDVLGLSISMQEQSANIDERQRGSPCCAQR